MGQLFSLYRSILVSDPWLQPSLFHGFPNPGILDYEAETGDVGRKEDLLATCQWRVGNRGMDPYVSRVRFRVYPRPYWNPEERLNYNPYSITPLRQTLGTSCCNTWLDFVLCLETLLSSILVITENEMATGRIRDEWVGVS